MTERKDLGNTRVSRKTSLSMLNTHLRSRGAPQTITHTYAQHHDGCDNNMMQHFLERFAIHHPLRVFKLLSSFCANEA